MTTERDSEYGYAGTAALVVVAIVVAKELWTAPYLLNPASRPLVAAMLSVSLLVLIWWCRGRLLRASLLFVSIATVVFGVDEFLLSLEPVIEPPAQFVGWLAGGLLELAGVSTKCADGELLIGGLRDAFSMRASWQLTGLRSGLAVLAGVGVLSLWLGRRKTWAGLALLALALLAALVIRYSLGILAYVSHEGVLAEREHTELAGFWNPWSLLAALGFATVVGTLRLRWVRVPAGLTWPDGRLALVASACGLVFGFFGSCESVGESKSGRVLIDDRLSRHWEPAGRLLTRDRFGDFSTYSFASLTEHLARRFAVSCNSTERYDRELLDGYDVLVLKTPNVPLSDAEVRSILGWVRDGGGLFAIGDHTDLEGMNTILNRLLRPAGIRMESDNVRSTTGSSFVHWRERLWAHPIAAGLGGMSFMSGCSITLTGGTPVMTARRVVADPGDHFGYSSFGKLAGSPAAPQGSLCVAACGQFGAGRMVAFTDSTVLSSFSYYQDGHDEFTLRSVAWLNRRNGRHDEVSRWLLLVAVAGLALWGCRRGNPGVGLPAAIVGALFGVIAASAWQGSAFAVPERSAASLDAAIVVDGGAVALPPVLGGQPDLDPGVNLATFAQLPQRLGMEMRVIRRAASELRGVELLIVCNPVDTPGVEWHRGVREWVERGGRLMVTSRSDVTGQTAASAFARGLELQVAPTESEELRVEWASCGAGRVALVHGSEALDATGLGHCMAVPSRVQQSRIRDVLRVIEGVLDLSEPERRIYLPTLGAAH